MKEIIEQIERHCKGRWPREFGKKLRRGFHRNDRVDSAEELYSKAELSDFLDCYSSVFAFKEWHDLAEERKRHVILDCLVFDLDCKQNPRMAFKETQRLVKWLLDKNITPRVYFSGCKGFHVYVDFSPVEISDFTAVRRVGVKTKERLKLQTVDTTIWEPNRLIRLPYTIHSRTGYLCTPLKPSSLLNLDFDTVLRYCKTAKIADINIEVHESKSFAKLIMYEDFKLATNKMLGKLQQRRARRQQKGNENGWREKRIDEYVEALRRYGRLTADPTISKRHNGNEHYARLYLNCLLIEGGYSDEEVKEIFKLCEDYNERIVEYQVRYNREWLKRQK